MFRFHSFIMALVTTSAVTGTAAACPFCSAVSQTFSEEMKTMDVVAIAELQKAALISKLSTTDPTAEVPKSRFKIVKVIKGEEFVKAGETFETIYFGEAKKDKPFLAMATDAPNLMWSTPLVLSPRAEAYLLKLSDLPKSAERLAFFQDYLEDEDEMLARDAYDEFAKAPYQDVIALKNDMKHDKLLAFIQDPQVPSNRRRLYFTMLGVCGTKADAKLLERLMSSEDRKEKAGLDAMLACYMILTGEAGLDRVDELFLRNSKAEYADTYAAIMAIRFHGSEVDVIPKSRLKHSLRLMLDRPELADLVIPDLARWEDWDVMPRLVKLFKDADENSSWVRVPVINYLRASPLPEAKTYIEELRKVDADAVKRAMTFFPLNTPASSEATDGEGDSESAATAAEPAPSPTASGQRQLNTETLLVAASGEAEESAEPSSEVDTTETAGSAREKPAAAVPVQKRTMVNDSVARTADLPATLDQAESLANQGANLFVLFGVVLGSGGIFFAAMRSILGCGIKADAT